MLLFTAPPPPSTTTTNHLVHLCRVCQTQPCAASLPTSFSLELGPWGPCNSSCGAGGRTRGAVCVSREGYVSSLAACTASPDGAIPFPCMYVHVHMYAFLAHAYVMVPPEPLNLPPANSAGWCCHLAATQNLPLHCGSDVSCLPARVTFGPTQNGSVTMQQAVVVAWHLVLHPARRMAYQVAASMRAFACWTPGRQTTPHSRVRKTRAMCSSGRRAS